MRKLLLFSIILFLFSQAGFADEGKKITIPVRVMEVELQDIQTTLDYVGDILAQDEAKVYPKVSGKIAEKIKEDGSPINKGEIIAYIDRDEVGFSYEKAPVESPLSGIVGRIYMDKGMSVNPQTPVALVVDMDKVKIQLDIPEKYLPKVLIGQVASINVDAYTEKVFMGNVSKISPVVDIETRTAPIEIIIPNEEHLLNPGMFARVKLVIEEHKNVSVILKEAIIGRSSNGYIYVINKNELIARKRAVRLGIQKGGLVEVIEGLKEGELVVIMGQQKLVDGAKVIIEEGLE